MIAKQRANRSELAKKICDRHNGVGADGLVVVLPHPNFDFEWEFYNSDGSAAMMCGNASRCVAHFAHQKGISVDGKAEFLTGAGVIRATINGEYVTTDMIEPHILSKQLDEGGKQWWLIDTGVPHLVAFVQTIDTFDTDEARALRQKYDANVNICKVENDALYVRTYERGVEDETLACGTGMMACFVRAREEQKIDQSAKLFPKSGEELYASYKDGIYRFGGRVTHLFDAQLYFV